MKQRLAWTGIAHLDRIACLDDRSGAEIIVDHRLDCSGTNVGWNVACLQFAKHLGMKTPSDTSIAIFTRCSWLRCMGLRVWKAATLDQRRSRNMARDSAG